MKIYLETFVRDNKHSDLEQIVEFCDEKNLPYKITNLGFYVELFDTGRFYELDICPNKSGFYRGKDAFDIYADSDNTFSICDDAEPDELFEVTVRGDGIKFDEELDKYGIWYYHCDWEYYIIGPDYSELKSFIDFCEIMEADYIVQDTKTYAA